MVIQAIPFLWAKYPEHSLPQYCLILMQSEENPYIHDERIPDPEEIRGRYPIEADSDTLEPFDDQSEHQQINADNPRDLNHWAEELQISTDELKAAIVLNGNSVCEIKKYLSV